MARLKRFQPKMDRNVVMLVCAMFFLQAAFGTSDRFKTLYIEQLGAKPAMIGFVLGLAEGIRLLFLVAAGPLSDRVSPRVLINMRWLAVGSALVYLFALNWWMLFPAFIFQASANLAWPSVSRVIDESGDDASRAHRFLLVYTIAPSVALLGAPLLGGAVAGRYGLRAVFVTLAIGLTISGIFFSMVRPASPGSRVTSGGYMALIRLWPANLIYLLTLVSMFFTGLGLMLAPNYLHNERGISFELIGAFGTLVAVGSILVATLLTRMKWLGRSLNGTVLTLLALPWVFALMLGSSAAVAVGAAYFFVGIASVTQQTLYGPLSEVTPPDLRVRAFALLEVTSSGAIMLAGFASGSLYAVRPSLPMWISLVGSIVVLVGALAVRQAVIAWTERQDIGTPKPARASI